jgi:hemolysin activation/secretion protein
MSRGEVLRGAAAFGLALLVPLAARGAGQEDGLRVGTITIRTENVFSPEEEASGRVYRSLNRVHVKTRPDVIRRFLLFREGEPFEPRALEETEKNLRTLAFLKSAAVTAGEPHGGVVDVLVVTQDRWTLLPGLPIASNGGTTTYGLQLLEQNFLGTGREISFAYNKEIERTTRVLALADPYLFGAYWSARLSQAWNSDGNRTRAEVTHAFSSLTSPRAHEFRLDVFGQTTRLYDAGDVSEAWHQDHREVALEMGWAPDASEQRAHRITAGVEIREDRFENVPERPADVLPDPRTFRYVFVGYEHAENDLLKLDYVNRDQSVEDFNLGRNLSVRIGLSPAIFGAPATTAFVRLRAAGGARLGENGFALAAVSWETRLDAGLKNEIVSASLDFVRKLRTKHPQTFVAKIRYDQGWNLDRDVQFIADGLVGLRGYRLYSFTGDKRAILNLEHRAFRGKEIWKLFSPGVAFFLDTGTAAPPGTPLRPSEFKTDVGFGLRMSVSRAPGDNVYRIDFAYALDHDPKGRRGLLVSFSASQGF